MVDDFNCNSAVTWSVLALIATLFAKMLFSRSTLDVQNKHVYITGGSTGLGFSLACQLAARGAHITIAARRQAQLDAAVTEIKSYCKSGHQKINSISVDLTDAKASENALQSAADAVSEGRVPDMVFCTAGAAASAFGLVVDSLTHENYEWAMKTNYFTALYTALCAAKRMADQKVPGKIVLVSSVAGMVSFAGYSAYSPSKAALRGLADALRNELLPYNISIHIHYPATIFSPGYEEERKTKPEVTSTIEGAGEGKTPEAVAQGLLKGLDRGDFIVTTDFIGHLIASNFTGASPRGPILRDSFLKFVGWIAFPIWRRIADKQSRDGQLQQRP